MNTRDKEFETLYEISQVINSIQEIEPLLEKVMDIAIEHLAAERGFIILKTDEASARFSVKVARNIPEKAAADITQISTSVVSQVIDRGEPVLSFDALQDERFDDAKSVLTHQIRSVACVPLRIKDKLIGAIYMDSRSRRGRFTQESLDFLSFFANQAAIAIENAQLYEKLKEENVLLKSEFHKMYAFDDIIGRSKSMQAVFGLVSKVLDSDTSVLVEGESGTGKELIAKTIHYNGKRKGRPFVPVNCSAIPETLLESELFGHKKGSFTGAVQDKKGLFEVADSGTLFLDEIGDITLPMQAKLLRVLQEREIRRIGETSSRNVDVRIIAATNKNLVEEIKAGRFREDLYYRLNVINILMPPLRERRKDIPLLAHHFLKKHAKLAGKRIKGFSSAALDHLVGYNWPGNVRELENTIERAVVLAQGELVEADDLFSAKPPPTDVLETGISLKECERRLIEKTLREAEGNKTRAARILGISLRTLHNKLKEWEDEDHRPV